MTTIALNVYFVLPPAHSWPRSAEGMHIMLLHSNRFMLSLSSLAALAGGCIGSEEEPSAYGVVSQELKEATPYGEREITIASSVTAECTLQDAAGESMPVFADDEGLVHVWAAPSKSREIYALDCEEPTGLEHYEFDLSKPATFVAAEPRVRARALKKIRRALEQPLEWSQEELIAGGYPPRPKSGTPAFDRWLDSVSREVTVITPRLVERDDIQFNPATNVSSGTWLGAVMNAPGRRYSAQAAYFTVPQWQVTGSFSKAAMWGGLDGWGSGTDIIQNGAFFQSIGSVTATSAWLEYFPLPPTFLTGLVTARGDSVTFQAWEGNASCSFGFPVGVGTGCFYYQNYTRGTTSGVIAVPAPNGSFTGATCEGVIERVGTGPAASRAPLSRWDGGAWSASMALDCFDLFGSYYNVTTDPYLKVNMVNAVANMAVASKGNPNLIGFDWLSAQ